MIAPNINGQARPFSKPVTTVYVAKDAGGNPVMPGAVSESGQWSAWEAGHEALEGFVDKAGTIYDPLLQAWILEPVYYYADHWILKSYDHENDAPIALPRPSTDDAGFYGWHVLAGGQAVYEGDYSNLTHLVSGLPYGTWVNTEASEDMGFRALRQQAPVALWAAMTEPDYPLPGDPSFEIMLRMDDLQASGSGAVPDPETAFVQFVFGGGRWRIVVRPDPKHILGAVAERKVRWQVSLWERSSTAQGGWVQRLGQEDGMDALKVDTDGYVHICVQCIDGCIVVRPDALSDDGAVYVHRTLEGTPLPVHVAPGPMVVLGRYVTCRFMVTRILYLKTGYVLFPALWPEYTSAATEDLVVKVMSTHGWGECGKPADTSPWLMTRFQYPMDPRNEWEKLGVGGYPLRWYDRNEAIQFYMGSPGQLSLSNLLREIPVLEWGAAIGATSANYLAALRLQGSNEDAWPPYWGTGDSGDDVALEGLSTHTLAVRLVKAQWPVVVTENTITWEQLSRDEWLSWSVNTVFDGETMGAMKGSLVRDDSHLQGAPGPLADLHGRRLYRVRGEWHSELGQWTAWDRYLLLGRGPTRRQQQGDVDWQDVLTLAADADRMHVPPTAGEKPSDLIEDYCLRAGIPSSYLDIEPSHRRVPLPAPPDTRRGRRAEHPLSFRDPINIYDAMRMVAEWEGHRLWCQRDKVVYRSPLSAPTSEALARAFQYSDGSNPATSASSWPVHESPSEEPTEDDREVTHVTVIGGDDEAPVTYTAVLQTTPRRDQSIEAVAGVGRRKDLVEVDRLVRSPAQAASKAYLRAHQLEVDRGDVSLTAPADPHLMLFDPGTLELSHHSLFEGKTMECVGLSESVTNDGQYMMTAQLRVKAGRSS